MIKKFHKNEKNWANKKISVINFSAIAAENYPINIILSERGQLGKTFSAKEYWLKKYEKNKSKAVWIFNTRTQLEKNRDRFWVENIKTNPVWKNFKATYRGLFDKRTGEQVIYFVNLTRAELEKGGRDSSITDIFYDEFNEFIYKIDEQAEKLENLLHTFTDPHSNLENVRLWIFGNQKTIATPLLVDLGVLKISNELTLFENLILIYQPTKKILETTEKYEKNWLWKLSKKLNLVDSSYFNINQIDNYDGIIDKKDLDGFEKIGSMKIRKRFFNVWTHFFTNDMFVERTTEPDLKNCIFFYNDDCDYGLSQNPKFLLELCGRVAMRDIEFDSVISKILVCSL